VTRPRSLSVLALVAVVALVAGACSKKSNNNAGGGTSGAKIVWGTTDPESSNDPAKCYEVFCSNLIQEVYSRLVSYPAQGADLVPDAASALPTVSTDGLTYTFTLKPNLKFSDGSALDASAVKYSIDRLVKQNVSGSAAFLISDSMQSVDAPDASTVVFHLKHADATFLAKLSFGEASIVNPKVMPENAVAPNKTVAGSGFYTMDPSKYVEGQSLELDANPKAVLGAPKNSTILIKFYSTSSALKLALENKEVDVAFHSFLPTEATSLKANPNIATAGPGVGRTRFLVFDQNIKPFDNIHMRKAIIYAISRDRINTDAFNGLAHPIYSMLRSSFSTYDPVFQTTYGSKPDVAKVNSELALAGVPAGQKVSITLWASTKHYGDAEQDAQESIRRQLQETGRFTITSKTEEWDAFKVDLSKPPGKFGLFLLGWLPDYFDPDDYISPFIGTSGAKSQGSFFSDPAVDSLINQEQAAKPDVRTSLLKQLQQIIADKALYDPLWEVADYVYAQKNVGGLALDVSSYLRIEELTKS